MRPFHFSKAVDGLILVGCELVVVQLVDFGVLDFSFGGVWNCVM